MPNWCSNTITITGNEGIIKTLTSVIRDINPEESKLFQSLIGLPEHLTEEQYEKEWYDTNVSWFGTKWDISYDKHSFEFTKTDITFFCDTAWSPPIPFLETLCKMYGVSAELFYSEPGIGFSGKTDFTWEGGELNVFDQEYEYRQGMYLLSNEEFWCDIESDIEYALDEETDMDEFLENYKSYVSEEDLEKIKTLYNEQKEDYYGNEQESEVE